MASQLSPAQYDYVCELVRRKSAIVLDHSKDYLLELRLGAMAQLKGFGSIGDLVEQIRKHPDGALETAAVEAMTTNETSFFRDVHPFEVLRTTLIPDVMKSHGDDKRINIWSAASSTGQEAYSIQLTLLDMAIPDWRISILGTDLSSSVVDKAKDGKFTQLEVNRGLPARYLARHFTKDGLIYQVKPEIRRAIEFRVMNLVGHWAPLPRMDIVFLRNVLIYFDLQVRRQILDRVADVMNPNGYLLLGGAENAFNLGDRFEHQRIGQTTVYRPVGRR